MKTPTTTKRMVHGYVILNKDGEWQGQVTTVMSEALLKAYKRAEEKGLLKILPCTISYQLPTPKKK